MAKKCLLGNQYCKDARFLWADVQEALDEFHESGHDKALWPAVNRAMDKYLAHRRKCSGGRMVHSLA